MTKALDSAMRLLTRREHSAKELRDKLRQKGFSQEEIDDVIDSCQRQDFQNDFRFVDNYIRSRVRQGYGPLKISQELKSKGVDTDLIHNGLKQERDNWFTHALNVWQKKSRAEGPLSVSELQKQQRFLLYRGFDMDIIAQVQKELT